MNDELKTAIMQLQCELVAERNRVNPAEISWLQYDILVTLSRTEHIYPSELCTLLGISRVKLAKSFKKLKQHHYIVQNRSDSDGRALLTKISDDGLAFLQRIDIGHEHLAQLVNEIFNPEQQQIFLQLATRLSETLKNRRVQHEE